MITDQIAVLNDTFASTGWSFNLIDTDTRMNEAWFRMMPGSSVEKQAKAALHKGGSGALDIYTCNPSGGVVGWATYPSEVARRPGHAHGFGLLGIPHSLSASTVSDRHYHVSGAWNRHMRL